MWLDTEGRRVLTAEPYHASDAEIAAFLTDMAELGLRVTFTGRSLWHPTTLMLIVQPAEPWPPASTLGDA